MAADPTIVASLVEFYAADAIRTMWQTAFQALIARSSQPVHITSGHQGGVSHSAIVLNTPDEIRNFISACQAAIAQLGGNQAIPPDQLGTTVSFMGRYVTA